MKQYLINSSLLILLGLLLPRLAIGQDQVELSEKLFEEAMASFDVNPAAAAAKMELASRLLPERSEFIYQTALYMARAGNLDKSVEYFNEYLRREPSGERSDLSRSLVVQISSLQEDEAFRKLKKLESQSVLEEDLRKQLKGDVAESIKAIKEASAELIRQHANN